jgi:hypothetical protein
MSNFWGLTYSSSSSGYLIMAGANKILRLMNPFRRKQKVIDTSVIDKGWTYFAGRVLHAFCKGSDKFVIMVSYKRLLGLYVYRTQNCSWQTYFNRGYPWMVVDFVVFNNIIYVLTNKTGIRVLSINFASLNFLKLKNTPTVSSVNLWSYN